MSSGNAMELKNSADIDSYNDLAKRAHPGLIFDKIFPVSISIHDKQGKVNNRSEKGVLFNALADANSNAEVFNNELLILPASLKQALQAKPSKLDNSSATGDAIKRQVKLVNSLRGKTFQVKSNWRFITGTGNAHRSELGMTFHHQLGAPYLPGSGVKGMLRAYLETLAEEFEDEDSNELFSLIDKVFGKANSDSDDTQPGCVCFFDALPTKRPKLCVDVMTPHFDKWYEKGGNETHALSNTPNEWSDPLPVQFLSVSDITLQFAIAPSPNTTEQVSDDELVFLVEMLKMALSEYGAGAKSSVGYGFFEACSI
ncbi:type III-B CRISPR module RAMP protein Cmr6 [Alteromonas gilva]|uniref:Type III-B CRISPR module RAMP protein Cmr6 n=1 Tax=Alteromonas gilva TaxID=2987522 RepID=A0ABT5L8B3_9ALTE|nr:type III-B CRISPR module RAMP protein Cmr6 [Alteromonas gilva]MDC8832073.1 type III-B CRISPR module RAMP protein Cmr6 [Alteromonas gilva]